jgi:hypothetical protein
MAETAPARPLTDADLSGLFAAADSLAVRAQRSYIRTMRFHYALLVLAALAGATSLRVGDGADLFAVAGAVCFGGSLLLRVYLTSQDSEVTWLRSRSVAESIKAESWRYAVAVEPYPDSISDADARTRFIRAQRNEVHDLGVAAARATALDYVTDRMQQLRTAEPAERQQAYLHGRLLDQMSWYARKSEQHARLANRWLLAMLLAEAGGMTAAVLKAAGLIDIDLLGVFGALASAFGAWNQMRQHRKTATIYRGTASRLATIAAHGAETMDAGEWAELVEDTEAILAEEGGAWRSLRSAQPGRAPEESVG